jgi:hypothetical protein
VLERKFQLLQELGPVYLTMEAPFSWIVVQEGILKVEPDGEAFPLQGRDCNPYGAIHRHWDLLTRGRAVLYTPYPHHRLVRWNMDHWTSVPAKKAFHEGAPDGEAGLEE